MGIFEVFLKEDHLPRIFSNQVSYSHSYTIKLKHLRQLGHRSNLIKYHLLTLHCIDSTQLEAETPCTARCLKALTSKLS